MGVCAALKSGLALNILNFRKEDEVYEDEMGILAVNSKPTDIGGLLLEVIKEQAPFVQEKKDKNCIQK